MPEKFQKVQNIIQTSSKMCVKISNNIAQIQLTNFYNCSGKTDRYQINMTNAHSI